MTPSGYIDLGYKPKKDDLVMTFYVEPAGKSSLEDATQHIAAESSIGTWTDISTTKPEIMRDLGPKAYEIDKANGLVKIAYTQDLFEDANMPQILSSVAGNIYGMKAVENLRVLDMTFPKNLARSFHGPSFGINGIRKILKVRDRPLVGTIIKPKLGLGAKDHAYVAYNSWTGGCDIVKDDENLTNQKFNPFKERITKTLSRRDKCEKETGEKKIYMPNVTAEANEMVRRAKYVAEHGGEYVMVDIVTCGFSGLQTLVDADLGLVIHAHRAMHAAFTRSKKHGFSMLALAKCARLVGVDQIHIGTVVGKMEGGAEEVLAIRDAMTEDLYGIKTVFPVCSGGLHPGHIPDLMRILGRDIIIQMGGGIHGHPGGTIEGAIAAREAVDVVMKGGSFEEYAKKHVELAAALKKWGRN